MAEEFDDIAAVTIQRCDALESVARQAWQAMTDLDERTDTLVGELETATADMGRRMQALVSDVATAKGRTETGTASVEAALQGLLQAVREAVSAHEKDAQRVVAAAETIGELPEGPAEVLGEVAPLIDKGVAGIDARVEALDQLLTRESEAALESLRSSAAALDAAVGSMDSSLNEWAEQLDALTVGAGERVAGLVRSLAASANLHARGTVDALNGALPAHGSLVALLASLLAEKTKEAIEPAVVALAGEQASLDAAVEGRTEALTKTIGTIGGTARETARRLDDVAAGMAVLTNLSARS